MVKTASSAGLTQNRSENILKNEQRIKEETVRNSEDGPE